MPMLFLDSASIDDARAARHLGWVAGITTNPSLMAAAGEPADRRLARLLEVFPAGPIFFQPTRPDGAEPEVDRAIEIAGDRLIVKLPAVEGMLRLGADLVRDGRRVAITAVYSPAQAVLGTAIGATWVIPYVDRAARLRPGTALLPSLRETLDALEDPPGILAASIKSPDQAVAALIAGANAVTAPLEVLRAMARDPLTEAAVDEFAAAADRADG
jgi:TalC/MipB family fructose-6-phosphate aldolase